MSRYFSTIKSISCAFPLLWLVGCQDPCHDGDPSTCCCRDRWGVCRDPSNGDLPGQDVTCTESRTDLWGSSNSSSGSGQGTVSPQPPVPKNGVLSMPNASSGVGNGLGWQWKVSVGSVEGVTLCCAAATEEPVLGGNCQVVYETQVSMHTDKDQILRCRSFKEGWDASPIGTIGIVGY